MAPKKFHCLFTLSTLLGLLGASGYVANAEDAVPMISPLTLSACEPHSATVSELGKKIVVKFGAAQWPNVEWTAPANQPWNWSSEDHLILRIENVNDDPIKVSVRIDDSTEADGIHHCITGTAIVPPERPRNLSMSLHSSDTYGMRGSPPLVDNPPPIGMDVAGSIDLSHVVAIQVFLESPPEPETFTIFNVGLVQAGKALYTGIVDQFGQFSKAEWPNKLFGEDDLKLRVDAEQAKMKSEPPPADRDRYGGWTGGPQLTATGFFRTEQWHGRWWMVTPDGHVFLSLGVDTMQPGDGTMVDGREYMFTWLPKPADALASFYGTANPLMGPLKSGKTFNFYGANLERKFGTDYRDKWLQESVDRLKWWGFTTIGNWSDSGLAALAQVPYVKTLGVSGDFARVPAPYDYWGAMPDPFDPKFEAAAPASIKDAAIATKSDQWCVGYFVDNELSWAAGADDQQYGLAIGTLDTGPSQPAKQAFVKQLRAKYSTIERLNSAWGVELGSWDDLMKPFTATTTHSADMTADLAQFTGAYATKYFTVISKTLKQYDPNHLYMGCRLASFAPEEAEAAAKICDVVSFNIYAKSLEPARWGFTNTLGKPCIIGEFHFGALDRGMFHPGLVEARDQVDRGKFYAAYIRSVLSYPSFVGAHWFQYTDEPLTGRAYDGENYNIGLVDVTDTPYPELTAAARAINNDAYSLHDSAAALPNN